MEIQKIKLIRVPENETYWLSTRKGPPYYFPPLALGNITSYLREKGFLVDQDDLNQKIHCHNLTQKQKINLDILKDTPRVINYIEGKNDDSIKTLLNYMINSTNLEDFDAYLISIEVLLRFSHTLGSTMSALILCKHLKETYGKPIILGGVLYPELLELNSKYELFDYALQGPGEIASYEMINTLNSNKNLEEVKGLIFWKNKKQKINKSQYDPIIIKPDFKGLPLELYKWSPPRWMQKFLKFEDKQKLLILPLRFITGCSNNCAFCSCDEKLQFLEPSKVVKILKELKEEYNSSHFIFFSNMLNISKKYVNELCEEIIKNKLNIYWSESFNPSNLDKHTISNLKKAGCIRASIGLETASPKLLKYTQRHTDLDQASRIIKDFDSEGIWVTVNVIAGLPKETKKDFNQTLDFLNKHKNYIDDLTSSQFTLMATSNMGKFPKNYDLKIRNLNYLTDKEFTYLYDKAVAHIEFDEEDGLKWEDKSKQINKHMEKFNFNFSNIILSPFLDRIPLMFYLYSNVKNKKEIKNINNKITKTLVKSHILKNPRDSIKKLFSVKNFKEFIVKLRQGI